MSNSQCKVAIIGGTSLLSSDLFRGVSPLEKGDVRVYQKDFKVEYGTVSIHFVQRHECGPATYNPPHKINYSGIALTLKELGITHVISVLSVGSLKTEIPVGAVLVPDDYFCPFKIVNCHDNHQAHFVPSLQTPFRKTLCSLFGQTGVRFIDGGVYVNTLGPRFETPSEIRFFSTIGEVIGMTGSFEATCLQECGFEHCMICFVDNMANGVTKDGNILTLESFSESVRDNQSNVEKILSNLVLNADALTGKR